MTDKHGNEIEDRIYNQKDFDPHTKLVKMSKADWEDISEEVFREIFRKSAVKRTKYDGLKRNIKFITNY